MAIYYAKSLMKAQLSQKVNTKIIQKLKRFVTLKKESKIKNVFIQKLKSQVKSNHVKYKLLIRDHT